MTLAARDRIWLRIVTVVVTIRYRQVVLGDQTIEPWAGYSQDPGGLALVAAGLVENGLNVRPLYGIERLPCLRARDRLSDNSTRVSK